MELGKFGFCDLNINLNDNVQETILEAHEIGYDTFVVNKYFNAQDAKKNKKGQLDLTDLLRPPDISSLTAKLQKLKKKSKIFTRITIEYSDVHYLFTIKSSIKNYDIIAYKPTTEVALKQILQSNIECDVITFDINGSIKLPRKLLKVAVKTDIYFEICYSPLLLNSDSRQKTIQFSHRLHSCLKSRNIFLSSSASYPSELRSPHDVAHLGLILGFTQAGGKAAVSSIPADAIRCARMRRDGVHKCLPTVSHFSTSSPEEREKFSSLNEIEKLMNKKFKS